MRLMNAAIIAIGLGCVMPCDGQAATSNLTTISQETVGELEAMHRQATESLIKNDFTDAIRIYSDILLKEPDDEVAYTNLGQIYMILGQQKKAHEAFKNALDINPHNETAIIGIQKILDPDGIEGMISKDEIKTEPYIPQKAKMEPIAVPEELKRSSVPLEIMNPEWIKNFTPAKRANPQRARAVIQPISISPQKLKSPAKREDAAQANVPVRPTFKRTHAPKLNTLMLRPGRLRLQRFQMALKNAGHYNGRVNGLLGGTTRRALLRFQKQNNLPVTGKTTAQTWEKLEPYLLKN